ncbi:uncharacterized protein [Macrobrachium rosenbergii]
MLICESNNFRIHRVIVSSVSKYLKKKFEEGHQLLVLEDIKPEILSLVLKFIYGGYVEVKEINLPAFLKAANFLQIKNIWCSEDTEKDLQIGNYAFQRKSQNSDKSVFLSDHEAPGKDDQITLEEKLKKNGVHVASNTKRTLLDIPAWLVSNESVSVSVICSKKSNNDLSTTVQSDKKKENRQGSHKDTSHQASYLNDEPYYLGTFHHQPGKRKYVTDTFSPQKWLNESSYQKVISPLHPSKVQRNLFLPYGNIVKESLTKSPRVRPSTQVKNGPAGWVKTRQFVFKEATSYKVSDVPKPQKTNWLTSVSPNHKKNCGAVPVQVEEPPVRKINYSQPTQLTEVDLPDLQITSSTSNYSEKSTQIDSSITQLTSETSSHFGNNEEIVFVIDESFDIVAPELTEETRFVTPDFSEHLYEELPDLENSPFLGFEAPLMEYVNDQQEEPQDMGNNQTPNGMTLTPLNENVTDINKKVNDQQEEPQDMGNNQTPDGMGLTPSDPWRSSNKRQGPKTRKSSKNTGGNMNENVADTTKKENQKIKPTICELCKTRCENKMALKMHLRTHIGKKYYTCSACTFKAQTKKALQVHITKKHRRKVLLNSEKTYNIF